MKTQIENYAPELREQFINACKGVSAATATLALLVQECVDEGVSREEMIGWAVDAGWSLSHARNTVNSLLKKAGKGVRKAGAGRKSSEEAQAILDLVKAKYPEMADVVLAKNLQSAAYLCKRSAAAQDADPSEKILEMVA